MAEKATIARPYAQALYRVAKASDLSTWSSLVTEMAQLTAHPDVATLIDNPKLTAQSLSETFLALLKTPPKGEGAKLTRLVNVLVDNRRLGVLPEIAAQFHVLKSADDNVADVKITSAFAMTEAQVSALLLTLEKKFDRTLGKAAHVDVDPSLIGGVRVVVGDEVFDRSVKTKLKQLQEALVA